MRAWGRVATPGRPRAAWASRSGPIPPAWAAGPPQGGRGSVGLALQGCTLPQGQETPSWPRYRLARVSWARPFAASEPGSSFVRGETLAAVPLRPFGHRHSRL